MLYRCHAVGPLCNRSCARQEINRKLDVAFRRHTWQIIRKDIREFRHHTNTVRGSSLHLMKKSRRLGSTDCHLLAIRCRQVNCPTSTINSDSPLGKSIHSQNHIDTLGVYHHQICTELYSPYGNTDSGAEDMRPQLSSR